LKKIKEFSAACIYLVIETAKISGILLVDGKTITLPYPFILLTRVYEKINIKHNKLLCKHLKLQLSYKNVNPGSILITKARVPTNPNISIRRPADRTHISIPKNEFVMFLGIVYDNFFEAPVIEILWGTRVLYMRSTRGVCSFEEVFDLAK